MLYPIASPGYRGGNHSANNINPPRVDGGWDCKAKRAEKKMWVVEVVEQGRIFVICIQFQFLSGNGITYSLDG